MQLNKEKKRKEYKVDSKHIVYELVQDKIMTSCKEKSPKNEKKGWVGAG